MFKKTFKENFLPILLIFIALGLGIAAASLAVDHIANTFASTNVTIQDGRTLISRDYMLEAFSSAQYVLGLLFVSNVIIFLVYLLYILNKMNRTEKLNAEKLQLANYHLELQQTLFDTYKDPDCIEQALKIAAGNFSAESAFLIVLNGSYIQNIHVWAVKNQLYWDQLTGTNVAAAFPTLEKQLADTPYISFDAAQKDHPLSEQEYALLGNLEVQSFLLVPVYNSNKHLSALLGTTNMERSDNDPEFLIDVAHEFMMALNSAEAYHLIQKMGSIDILTGLKNRNSYQQFLAQAPAIESDCFGCIYIDANGLHELNNLLGHAAGDTMLRILGHSLSNIFHDDEIFRIGGDECVVFTTAAQDDVEEKINLFTTQMQESEYDVSVGFAWAGTSWNLTKLIAEAESRMYEDKHLFYQQHGNEKKSRDMNRKLEQILQEKQDADTFLSIISPYFMGVYVVDLVTDQTRIIYQPSYFSAMLEQTEYRFMEALRQYVEDFVIAEEQPAFLEFLDYEQIGETLKNGKTIEYRYHKKDGNQLFLRVCKTADYGEDKKEAFWIFENYS